MNNASWHRFQILTKRSKRLQKISPTLSWTSNIWMGVTVESDHYRYRIDDLRQSPAYIKFLSLEPLLSPLKELDLENIDWVREIRDHCLASNTPFFFKQWGSPRKKKNGRTLDGRLWDELPLKAL
jgi:protein gp37